MQLRRDDERGFNSRPREAGDSSFSPFLQRKQVSIHARARRATVALLLQRPGGQVSIHARARRATQGVVADAAALGFNSRPREAGDRDNYCNYRHRRHDIRRSTGDMIAYSVRNCSNKPAKSLQINCQRSRFPRTRRQLHVSLWFAQRFCNTMPEAHLHWDRPSLLLHSEPPFPRSCFPCYSTSGCQALDRI